MLRPFRPLKMSAAQGFVRVRISKFHIVLACFSCILPEQGLHLRYTESCPRGRRCDTRNFGRACDFRPPLLLNVPQHRKSQNRIFFAFSPVFSPTNFRAIFWKKARMKIDTESCPSGRRCSTRNRVGRFPG